MSENKGAWVRWPEIAYAASLVLLLCMMSFFMKMPRVGVVDTDRVCRELGEEARMAGDMKAWRERAKVEVDALRDSFRSQADTLLAQVEKTTDPAEKERIRTKLAELQRSTQDTVERMGREMMIRNEKQKQDFKSRLRPTIDEVARGHHFEVMLDGGGGAGIMYVRQTPFKHGRVDVTDEVIEKARVTFTGVGSSETPAVAAMPDNAGTTQGTAAETGSADVK